MKVERQRIKVTFDKPGEAARYIAKYESESASRLYGILREEFPGFCDDDVLQEAARDIATRYGLLSPASSPAPTYISGSDEDKVYNIATMPTRYIVNCVRMTDERLARGVRRELEAELARRKERGDA